MSSFVPVEVEEPSTCDYSLVDDAKVELFLFQHFNMLLLCSLPLIGKFQKQ